MIEKFPGKCCFPLSVLVSSRKIRLRNSDLFVGCFHRLNYSSVGLSILTSCAKVPGLCPAWGGLMPGRLTNLDESRTSFYCPCSGCVWGLFGNLFSRLSFLFSFSLSWRQPDID